MELTLSAVIQNITLRCYGVNFRLGDSWIAYLQFAVIFLNAVNSGRFHSLNSVDFADLEPFHSVK